MHQLASNVKHTAFVTYERSYQVRPDSGAEASPLDLNIGFSVSPEQLGVRVTIEDDNGKRRIKADVALLFEWIEPVSADDDVDEFAAELGLPQTLAAASAIFGETMQSSGDAETQAPYYALETQQLLVDRFMSGPRLTSFLPGAAE